MYLVNIKLFLTITWLNLVYCSHITSKNLTSIELETFPMLLYLNNTNYRGSKGLDDTGSTILVPIENENDLNDKLKNIIPKSLNKRKISILLNGILFKKDILLKLCDISEVKAIIVYDEPLSSPSEITNLHAYSPDNKHLIPGDYHYPSEYEWNPNGDDLFQTYFSKPIVYVNETISNQLLKVARHNNNHDFSSKYPLYSFKLSRTYNAEDNASTCLGDCLIYL